MEKETIKGTILGVLIVIGIIMFLVGSVVYLEYKPIIKEKVQKGCYERSFDQTSLGLESEYEEDLLVRLGLAMGVCE